jgi:hypothetical protein
VLITEREGDDVKLIRMLTTDASGYTETVPLSVPVYDLNEYPDPMKKPYRDYRISAYANGYYIVEDVKVPIFAGVKSLQPIQMVPLRENESRANILPPNPNSAVNPNNIQSAAGAPVNVDDAAATPPLGTVG